jgi:DNA topoisomerase I
MDTATVVSPDEQAARQELRELGLRYVPDGKAGITRRRRGRGFSYRCADGSPLRDRQILAWIRSLAIPPAWRQVWISPSRNGHLLATGRDARGRKQYRYHPTWRQLRDETKFERMAAFGKALPRIRAAVEAELRKPGLGRSLHLRSGQPTDLTWFCASLSGRLLATRRGGCRGAGRR